MAKKTAHRLQADRSGPHLVAATFCRALGDDEKHGGIILEGINNQFYGEPVEARVGTGTKTLLKTEVGLALIFNPGNFSGVARCRLQAPGGDKLVPFEVPFEGTPHLVKVYMAFEFSVTPGEWGPLDLFVNDRWVTQITSTLLPRPETRIGVPRAPGSGTVH